MSKDKSDVWTRVKKPEPKGTKLTYNQIIKAVARQAHLPDDTVRVVIDTLWDVIRDGLRAQHILVLREFGTFRPRRTMKNNVEGLAIKFRPSPGFKQSVKEALPPMEKYGVQLKDEAVLLAKVTGECPACKSKLDQKDPPHCPNCGTAPFEKKES